MTMFVSTCYRTRLSLDSKETCSSLKKQLEMDDHHHPRTPHYAQSQQISPIPKTPNFTSSNFTNSQNPKLKP